LLTIRVAQSLRISVETSAHKTIMGKSQLFVQLNCVSQYGKAENYVDATIQYIYIVLCNFFWA
jgi:hypothetical protein